MLRRLVQLLLLGGVVMLMLPFLVASFYVDQRGVTIPGRVSSKSEYIRSHDETWSRLCDITIEYSPPDSGITGFQKVPLPPERYDQFHKGQPVTLHYLLKKDIPDLPLAHFLREFHALPMARLVGESAFSGLQEFFTGTRVVLTAAIAGMVLLLILWRTSGIRGFAWAVAACVLLTLAVVMVIDFPKPQPAPVTDVRRAAGTVKSLDKITRLFDGKHSRGFELDQPIQVLGVEFTPAGMTDPVVAVDLIDAGSVPGLKEGGAIDIDYEGAHPRVAHIPNATRTFVSKSLSSIGFQLFLGFLVLVVFVVGAHFLGKAWNRLVARR